MATRRKCREQCGHGRRCLEHLWLDLMFRGIRSMPDGSWQLWKIAVSVAGGLLFFRILFLLK